MCSWMEVNNGLRASIALSVMGNKQGRWEDYRTSGVRTRRRLLVTLPIGALTTPQTISPPSLLTLFTLVPSSLFVGVLTLASHYRPRPQTPVYLLYLQQKIFQGSNRLSLSYTITDCFPNIFKVYLYILFSVIINLHIVKLSSLIAES